MKLATITSLAESLLEQLRSACVRIEIKGSICRLKPEPNDIEIVCIPALGEYTIRDLFGQPVETQPIDYLAEALTCLLVDGRWELDPIVRRNGAHYKRLRHVETLTACDLFITDRLRWGIIATVRTGPGDFSKALMTLAHRKRMFIKDGLLHNHPPVFDQDGDVKACPSGDRCLRIIDTPEEADVFRALGLPWIEPPQRLSALPALTGKVWKSF